MESVEVFCKDKDYFLTIPLFSVLKMDVREPFVVKHGWVYGDVKI
jgi:hypothetical protein